MQWNVTDITLFTFTSMCHTLKVCSCYIFNEQTGLHGSQTHDLLVPSFFLLFVRLFVRASVLACVRACVPSFVLSFIHSFVRSSFLLNHATFLTAVWFFVWYPHCRVVLWCVIFQYTGLMLNTVDWWLPNFTFKSYRRTRDNSQCNHTQIPKPRTLLFGLCGDI